MIQFLSSALPGKRHIEASACLTCPQRNFSAPGQAIYILGGVLALGPLPFSVGFDVLECYACYPVLVTASMPSLYHRKDLIYCRRRKDMKEDELTLLDSFRSARFFFNRKILQILITATHVLLVLI